MGRRFVHAFAKFWLSIAATIAAQAASPIDTLQPGEWYEVPASNMNAVDPCPAGGCVYSGATGARSVMDAWGGGVYDSTRDRLITWGGGHADYAGNEVYAFGPLTSASPTWQRVTEPSTSIQQNVTHYPDGKPSARHSYNYLVYDTVRDSMFSLAGSATYGSPGGGSNEVDSFNFATGTWRSNWPVNSGANAIAAIAAYDSVLNVSWYHGTFSSPLVKFDPAGNGGAGAVTTYPTYIYLNYYATPAIDTKRHKMLAIGGYGGARQFFLWDLNNPGAAPTSPSTSGAAGGVALESSAAPGFAYDPIGDRYVVWNGGTTVYTLNPDTWVWTQVNAAATNTVAANKLTANSNGTYGRFRYIPSKNAFVVVNRTNENVFFYKLSASTGGGATPTPTVTLTAIPASVTSGAAATLNWSSANATSCAASGAWSGTKAISGTQSTRPLTAAATYTLTCTGAGGSASQSATVTVTVSTPPPAGAITTVQLINTSASSQTSAVATFGHAFRQGDVPAGSTVIAKDSSGNPVTLQVDKKATHADGSLRHAILTAKLPALAGSATQTITLYAQANGTPQTPVSLASLLATAFDSQVSLKAGGAVYTASAQDLLQNTTPKPWLSGPEVSEWIVGGPVKDGNGNPHAHLAAYFHIRAYAGSPITKVRVDAVVENNWTFKAGATSFSYIPAVTVGAATIYNNGGASLTQYHHTRWHQAGWWNNTDPRISVKPDTQYLRDTKLVPNYANLTLQQSTLNRYSQANVPMDIANMRVDWSGTGYDMQIGVVPEWYAAYIISGDIRAYNGVLANDSAGGSYSYHYRDENTGLIPSIDTYPLLSEQFPETGLVAGTGGNPNVHDSSHSPLIGYLGYLLTGDYYYLEELQFLSNWTMLQLNYAYRQYAKGVFAGQNRSMAWSLRTLAAAAAITPDSATFTKSYLTDKLNNNVNDLATNWSLGPTNVLGAVQDYGWNPPTLYYYSPWMNNFFVAAANWTVDLGFNSANALSLRNWFNRWPAGLMGQDNSGFCPYYAGIYNMDAGIVDANNVYRNFLQLYQAQFPVESAQPCPASGLMLNGYPATAGGYYSNIQPALAMAVDAGQATLATWNKFVSMGTPDYTADPVWGIVPRGN